MFHTARARLRALFHPELFHGHGRRRRKGFFEGWYFKFVDVSRHCARAIIPGVFYGRDPHAFIQVLDGETGKSFYHRFPVEAFHADDSEFSVHIAGNHFSSRGITLDISGEQAISGELRFEGLAPWPRSPLSPGIMGPFSFVPFMECCHGVVSLDHLLSGRLAHQGEKIDFHGGRGYLEKDWGRSFPRAWVWMQSNHFPTTGTSLSLSIGLIPWLGSSFVGFIAGFLHKGELLRFATYTGAKLQGLRIDGQGVSLSLQGRRHTLTVSASRAMAGLLHGPVRPDTRGETRMEPRVLESLSAQLVVTLTDNPTGETVFQGTGHRGGLEIGGEIHTLLR